MKSTHADKMEIIALRSQLAVYIQHYKKENLAKPIFTRPFRQLWVLLSKNMVNLKEVFHNVKPDKVIGWHRTDFKFHWIQKLKKIRRPKISTAPISLIKKVHKENPLLSPEKIHEKVVWCTR